MSGVPTKAQGEILELLAQRAGRDVDDITELWQERAAIREYEGGKKRKEAERLAIDDAANMVLDDGASPCRATVSVAPRDGAGAS